MSLVPTLSTHYPMQSILLCLWYRWPILYHDRRSSSKWSLLLLWRLVESLVRGRDSLHWGYSGWLQLTHSRWTGVVFAHMTLIKVRPWFTCARSSHRWIAPPLPHSLNSTLLILLHTHCTHIYSHTSYFIKNNSPHLSLLQNMMIIIIVHYNIYSTSCTCMIPIGPDKYKVRELIVIYMIEVLSWLVEVIY
jgi:hypothetical protein